MLTPEPVVAGGFSVEPLPAGGLLEVTPAVAPPVVAVPHGSPFAPVRLELEPVELAALGALGSVLPGAGEKLGLEALGLPGEAVLPLVVMLAPPVAPMAAPPASAASVTPVLPSRTMAAVRANRCLI